MRVEEWASLGSGSSAWEIDRRASPGNLQAFDATLFGNEAVMEAPAVMMAIFTSSSGGAVNVGVSYADPTARSFGVCEFTEVGGCA